MTDEKNKIQVLDAVAPVWRRTTAGHCVRNKESFVSHFATCPKASEFSKKKKKHE